LWQTHENPSAAEDGQGCFQQSELPVPLLHKEQLQYLFYSQNSPNFDYSYHFTIIPPFLREFKKFVIRNVVKTPIAWKKIDHSSYNPILAF
jgi:hypothetical protein